MKQESLHVYDVVVIGGGAAGLFCAMTAAQQKRRVLVIEKSNKIGKKILMSGGGRCNFTNYSVEADNYLSMNPHFSKAALKRYSQWDFIALVERHNIAYEERAHGQLFCQDSSQSILRMLLDECEHAGVTIKTHCELGDLEAIPVDATQCINNTKGSARYQLGFNQVKKAQSKSYVVQTSSVVVASGALSIPSLGGSGAGYDLAQQFSLGLVERRAGLVPFMFSDGIKALCERLAGVSVAVEVSCNDRMFKENLLFTHRGLSGPAILQISNYWLPGDEISVNLLPEIEAIPYLLAAKKSHGKKRLVSVLNSKLGKSLSKELENLFFSKYKENSLAEISDKVLSNIGQHLNDWRLKPSGTEGYRTAEVTLGGIDTDAISSRTMEVKNQPGLFFIGEVIDVTGHLGGYNFQWAWSSGYSAGLFA